MARKTNPDLRWYDHLGESTRHSIVAIALIVVGVFLVLAALGAAGVAGRGAYRLFTALLGRGYLLAPAAALGAGSIIIMERRPKILHHTAIGGGLFLLGALGIADVMFDE